MTTREQTKTHFEGPGWSTLIDIAFDNKPDHITIKEVFQKWGCLTVRYDGEDIHFEELTQWVEYMSAKMCELCGTSGEETIMDGYVITLCDEHYKSYAAKEKYRDEVGNVMWKNKCK